MESVPTEFLEFVDKCMQSFKCSTHDMSHCLRVSRLATHIARCSGADERLVAITALSHDILDSKLVSEENSVDMEATLISELSKFNDRETVDRVLSMIKKIGYKHLLKTDHDIAAQSIEHKCVQDADLLDAIGAIGIARCFAYCGKRNQSLFDLEDINRVMDSATYSSNKGSNSGGIQHFFDKLLLLKNYVCTDEGKRLALARQSTMLSFLRSVADELIIAGDSNGSILATKLDTLNH